MAFYIDSSVPGYPWKGFCMNTKLYVGNLSYQATEDEVRTLFSEVGTVTSVSLMTDRDTGRPKGFGFVEMETAEAAQLAIRTFNGRVLHDRKLKVDEAHPPRERGSREGGFGQSRGGGGYGGSRGGGFDRGKSGGFGGGRRSDSSGHDRGKSRGPSRRSDY
jgi:RNA recognition motif-containing protein